MEFRQVLTWLIRIKLGVSLTLQDMLVGFFDAGQERADAPVCAPIL
jgi:hypothetical protein